MPEQLTQREYWNGKVGEEWVAHADRMDGMLAPMSAAGLAALKLKAGERVLDIGCGAGATTFDIAREVGTSGRAVGVDISHPLVQLARQRTGAQSVDFVEADAGADAIAGAPFDAAFSRFGVMFFADPAAAFTHLRGALRPGGRLTFVCWRGLHENIWSLTPIQAIFPILKAPLQPPDPDAPGPFAFADDAKIRRILDTSGWKNVAIDPWNGAMTFSGGPEATAAFMIKIGPCARAVAEQELDHAEVLRRVIDILKNHETPAGISLPAACWIVRANA